jgi:hypothetical protein
MALRQAMPRAFRSPSTSFAATHGFHSGRCSRIKPPTRFGVRPCRPRSPAGYARMRSNDFAAASYRQNSSASHASSARSALLIIDRRLRSSSLRGPVSLGTEATCCDRNPDAVERQSPHTAAVGHRSGRLQWTASEEHRAGSRPVVPAYTGLTREGAGLSWQEVTGHGRRALVETTMCRCTAPIWPRLRARLDAGRRTEAAAGAVVLNRILSAGRPNSVRSARGAT